MKKWKPERERNRRQDKGLRRKSETADRAKSESAGANEGGYQVLGGEKGVPIKAWTRGVAIEEQAQKQLLNVAQMPFIFRWVAAMPDVHWGIGATVGSVIPTKGAIIPAAVGVDIGCGMMAV